MGKDKGGIIDHNPVSKLRYQHESSDTYCLCRRAWIIRAYLSCGIDHEFAVGIQFYENALEILERGRGIWQDIPPAERGDIFDDNFIRCVRTLLNQEYMNVRIPQFFLFKKKGSVLTSA